MKNLLCFLVLMCSLLSPMLCEAVDASQPSQSSESGNTWSQLLQDSIEAAPTIQNSVERNKFLRLITDLQEQTSELPTTPPTQNRFLIEHYQMEWKAVNDRLKSRLTSASQNIPDGNDKTLIVSMLQTLSQEAKTKLPAADSTSVAVISPPLSIAAEKGRQLYTNDWLRSQLPQLQKQLGNFSPTVFISYAWGPTENAFVPQLADYLRIAGIQVRLDTVNNGLSTSINTGFVTELENVDYILVVGSKLYGDKARLGKNNVVATETRIIADRNKRQPGRVLPLLLSGDPKEAFPPFMRDKVFVNFTDPKLYVQELNKVILAVSKYADNQAELMKTMQAINDGAVQIQNMSEQQLIVRYQREQDEQQQKQAALGDKMKGTLLE